LETHRVAIEEEDLTSMEVAKFATKLWDFLSTFLSTDVVRNAVGKAQNEDDTGNGILGPLLSSVLTLKLEMVTCYSQFEIVFFTSGSSFHPEVMETTTSTAAEPPEPTRGRRIEFCRVPALLIRPGPSDAAAISLDAPNIEHALENAIVQMRIPITFTDEWKGFSGIVMKKAIVLSTPRYSFRPRKSGQEGLFHDGSLTTYHGRRLI